MSENKKNTNTDFDFDEIDELPDVVLGEKTRAMRTLKEHGTPQKHSQKQDTNPSDKRLQRINVYDQTTGLPSVDDLLKEEIKVEPKKDNADPIEKQIDATSTTKQEDNADISKGLEELKKGQKYKNGTKIDYLGNEVEIEDFNPQTSRYKIVDNGRTKWVTDKNLKLIDPEIPSSLQDEDPGVEDELSEALETKQENTVNTDALPETQNELSKVYEENTTSTPKHARTNKQPVVKPTVPFEQLYKEAYIPYTESEEERAARMKKRKTTPMMQKIVACILVILLAILAFGVYTIYSGLQPVSSKSEEVNFMVDDGSTVKSVAQGLQKEGIIKNADVAYTYARFFNLTDIKKGLFTLDKSWDIKQIFTYLNDSKAVKLDLASVTVIEGDWAKDIAKKFSESTNVSSEELLALWNNQEWISSQKETYPFITDDMFKEDVRIYLEGYLAPETYYIDKETTAEDITKTLLDQSLVVYNKYADAIEKSGRSIADIYTMASIIQYEAGTNPDDLAKVASVFYNRLDQGMMLQSSVTVCYAIDFDKQEDNWQACEVNPTFDSPYNTYAHAGLTPGPIENPGEAAIKAAIEPADTKYLYFMAEVCPGGDGTVHYAETLDEHNANVAKYLTCY